LTQQGQENPASLLRNLASQLGQLFDTNDDGDSDHSECKNPQNYAKFIRELLQAEAESKGDIKVISPSLAGRQHLLNDRFAETLQQVVQNFIAEAPEAIEFILGDLGNLSIHINDFPLGKRANNLQIAITGYQILLNNSEPRSENWATTQNNLAAAYRERIRGEKAENIEQATKCYRQALEIPTPSAFPLECLQTGRNLGKLAFELQDWENAIYGYENAITAVEQSREWATSQRSKRQILEDALPIYENLVQACIHLEGYETALLTAHV
jgi:tetratricopeptide (TPR) repeat protein